jgi:hypothetical protein
VRCPNVEIVTEECEGYGKRAERNFSIASWVNVRMTVADGRDDLRHLDNDFVSFH